MKHKSQIVEKEKKKVQDDLWQDASLTELLISDTPVFRAADENVIFAQGASLCFTK